MTQPVEHLVHFLSGLPENRQSRIATLLLEQAKWEAALETAEGGSFYDYLIRKTERDAAEQRGMPLDEFLDWADAFNAANPD